MRGLAKDRFSQIRIRVSRAHLVELCRLLESQPKEQLVDLPTALGNLLTKNQEVDETLTIEESFEIVRKFEQNWAHRLLSQEKGRDYAKG